MLNLLKPLDNSGPPDKHLDLFFYFTLTARVILRQVVYRWHKVVLCVKLDNYSVTVASLDYEQHWIIDKFHYNTGYSIYLVGS